MAVNTTWSDPSVAGSGAGLDLATGDVLTEVVYDRLISDLYRLGGTDGNTKTGGYTVNGIVTANGAGSYFNSAIGVADDTNYFPYADSNGAGGTTSNVQCYTTQNITTAKTIGNVAGFAGALFIVAGTDGTNKFCDLVLCGTGTTFSVLASLTTGGAPAARTYSVSGGASLQLAMASGTYRTRTLAFAVGYR